jgi:AcrR family transcriptional regulator
MTQETKPTDHRTLVAVERREKTRTKLLRGAIQVFAQHGAEARVIDLVIRQAGVSRGTFYNYFRTNDELFLEVAREVSNEIITIVDPIVQRQQDAAASLACGLVSVVRLALINPVLAQFVSKGGPDALSAGNLTNTVVPREIRNGMAAGLFTVPDEQLAFDMVFGPVLMAFNAVINGRASEEYARNLAQAVLQSLGLEAGRARGYARLDFDAISIPARSLFHC